MIELIRAIVTRVRARSDYATLLPGGVFHGPAAGTVTMPYLVLDHIISHDEDEDTGASVTHKISVMFSLYAKSTASLSGDEVADDAMNAIERDFLRNHDDIIVSGAHLLRVERTGEGLLQEPERETDGAVVWRSTRVYEFSLHENLTET